MREVKKPQRFHDKWHGKPKIRLASIICGMLGIQQLVFRNNKIAEQSRSVQILKNSFHAGPPAITHYSGWTVGKSPEYGQMEKLHIQELMFFFYTSFLKYFYFGLVDFRK